MLLRMVEEERAVIEREDKLAEAAESKMNVNENVAVGDEVTKEDENQGVNVSVAVMEASSSSSSSSSSSDEEVVSSPNCNDSPDMIATRSMYKRTRSRANTLLPGSGLLRSPQRQMSRKELQRRRFISQDSIKSIQTIIANIEKKRSENN